MKPTHPRRHRPIRSDAKPCSKRPTGRADGQRAPDRGEPDRSEGVRRPLQTRPAIHQDDRCRGFSKQRIHRHPGPILPPTPVHLGEDADRHRLGTRKGKEARQNRWTIASWQLAATTVDVFVAASIIACDPASFPSQRKPQAGSFRLKVPAVVVESTPACGDRLDNCGPSPQIGVSSPSDNSVRHEREASCEQVY